MKVPFSWLQDYVLPDVPLEELCHRLTMAGIEVAGVSHIGSWNMVKVGLVKKVMPHPNADRLRLVTVYDGSNEDGLDVVCGAPNVAEGQKIAFASVGAVLTDGKTGKPGVKLRRSKIRGVVSEGMVCSRRELGLGDEHEGILVLDDSLEPGTPLADAMGDSIIEMDVTPNRPDCFSIVGVAREVSALTGARLSMPNLDYDMAGRNVEDLVSVRIDAPDLCPRYVAGVIKGVRVGPSPEWMQERLRRVGERPINNVVDATNYVMLELGQPLHAFDYGKVADSCVIVRRARQGERIVTLDGSERELDEENLLIADTGGAIALAGVMGGAESEIRAETRDVLLEGASFNRVNIRRTAKRLGIHSQAALRFERGLRTDLPEIAVRRAMRMILEVAGGEAASGLRDEYPGDEENLKTVHLPHTAIKRVLGITLERERVEAVLHSIGFVPKRTDEGWDVPVPWWRSDVRIAEDLCEELARIIGYDDIPYDKFLQGAPPLSFPSKDMILRRDIVRFLVDAGMQEVITHSAVSPMMEARTRMADSLPSPVELINPVSAEKGSMRRTLRTTVLEVVSENSRTWRGTIKIFECGNVFHLREEEPTEYTSVVGYFAGPRNYLHWDIDKRNADFFDAKGAVEFLMESFGLVGTFKQASDDMLITGRTADVTTEGVRVGVVGEVRSDVLTAFDVKAEKVAMFELDFAALRRVIDMKRAYSIEADVRTPESFRDIALVVARDVDAERILRIAGNSRYLKNATVFDVYEGAEVPKGKKSVALRLTFQTPNRTLTSSNVDSAISSILAALEGECGAILRDITKESDFPSGASDARYSDHDTKVK